MSEAGRKACVKPEAQNSLARLNWREPKEERDEIRQERSAGPYHAEYYRPN